MKNQNFILLAMLILASMILVSLVQGIDLDDINIDVMDIEFISADSTMPVIRLDFSNEQDLVSINAGYPKLIDENAEELALTQLSSTERNVFRYKPVNELEHLQSYLFIVRYNDGHGNEAEKTVIFTVELADIEIQLVQPKYGFSTTEVFTVAVNTSRTSLCR